jgi:tetratricopeptide (TPR) repeat protein
MGNVARILAALAIVALGTLPVAAFDGATQTTAPKKKANSTNKPGDAAADKDDKSAGATDDKQKAAELAKRTLEAAIKAYESNKADEAIKGLDAALHAGLSGQLTARALYYRGLANRKLGKPGLAISDLTSALWLKDGLVGTDREAALKNRAAAYQEAGISTVPDVPQSSNSVVPAIAADPTGWQTAMNGTPSAAAPAPAAPTAAPPAAQAPPATTATVPADQPSQSTGGVGGFFNSIGNFFTGGSSSTPNANDGAVTTSSITPPAPQPAPAPAPVSDTGGWSPTTQAARGPEVGSAFVTKVSTSGKEAPAEKVAARAPSGKFRLQVAAVRSRSEADALAAKLLANHGSELGPRQPEISEAVLGNMGTFYRVRVGPYADAKEPLQLCGGLRSSGFDCLVVTQ